MTVATGRLGPGVAGNAQEMSSSLSRRWSAPAVPGSVPSLRREVVAFVADNRVGEPPLGDVRLALSEALTNVVLHGYRDRRKPGAVDVRATVGAGRLEVVVGDEGMGMSARSDSPGAGLGLPLIARLAQRMEICPRTPQGTELHLGFDL